MSLHYPTPLPTITLNPRALCENAQINLTNKIRKLVMIDVAFHMSACRSWLQSHPYILSPKPTGSPFCVFGGKGEYIIMPLFLMLLGVFGGGVGRSPD